MSPDHLQALIALLTALEQDTNSVKVTDASRVVRRAALARLSRLGRDGHTASPRVLADPRQLAMPLDGHHGREVMPDVKADEEGREGEALLNVKQG